MKRFNREPHRENLQSAKTLTLVIYALQATSFLFGITFLVAVIINYVKQDDMKGTWLESHFRWQIRTFWFSLLWSIVGFITSFIVFGYVILAINVVWVIYRIAKGWIRLTDEKEIFVL
jgi:uncharacterized membrane protein